MKLECNKRRYRSAGFASVAGVGFAAAAEQQLFTKAPFGSVISDY